MRMRVSFFIAFPGRVCCSFLSPSRRLSFIEQPQAFNALPVPAETHNHVSSCVSPFSLQSQITGILCATCPCCDTQPHGLIPVSTASTTQVARTSRSTQSGHDTRTQKHVSPQWWMAKCCVPLTARRCASLCCSHPRCVFAAKQPCTTCSICSCVRQSHPVFADWQGRVLQSEDAACTATYVCAAMHRRRRLLAWW